MDFDLVIRNAAVALNKPKAEADFQTVMADIGIKNGKIAELGQLSGRSAENTLDAEGLHVLPGVIDSQVHFREPGNEHKENLQSGTQAAALGGVTTVFEMPNTNPPTTTAEALADKLRRAEGRAWCNYAFFMGAAEENASNTGELEKLPGCVGFKIFMGSSTGTLLVDDDSVLQAVLSSGRRRLAVHAEDETRLKERRHIVEESHSVLDHPVWRDEQTAYLATERITRLAKNAGRPAHVLHITTAEELDLLRKMKTQAQITVECTPQHLTLKAPDCYERLGTKAQMNPPIREERHQKALWKALLDGKVDVIGSDHAPHTLEEKAREYPNTPSGMPGVQTLLPVMLNHVHNGRLTLEQLIRLVCVSPAKIYGLKNKGAIREGFDADLTLVDLNKRQTITDSWIASICGWTPYDGMEITGWPEGTIVCGQISMWRGKLADKAYGRPCEFDF